MKLDSINEGILFEGGLSRVLAHVQSTPFTVITAFRSDYSLADNRHRNRVLENRFREIGAGGIKLVGHWLEAPEGMWFGKDLSEINPKQLINVVEESYLVPMPSGMSVQVFKNWVVSVLAEFSQDAAVFSDERGVALIDRSGDLTSIGSGITVDKITQAYSTMASTISAANHDSTVSSPRINFVFEGSIRPSGIAHRMLMKKRNVFWV